MKYEHEDKEEMEDERSREGVNRLAQKASKRAVKNVQSREEASAKNSVMRVKQWPRRAWLRAWDVNRLLRARGRSRPQRRGAPILVREGVAT